jgi:hypothetical protein
MVRGSKQYVTKQYCYKTVHVTKLYTVTKWFVITVQYRNGLVGRSA